MPGNIEGGPYGEPIPQQTKPEQIQPVQGRTEGRESLQGPTTVDRSEQVKSDAERLYGRRLEEIREVYEKNPIVFAMRAMEALDWLLKTKIPTIEQVEERERQELLSRLNALGRRPDREWWEKASSKRNTEGYHRGLQDAFLGIYERITGDAAYLYPLGKEPEHLKDGRRKQS